MYRKSCFSAMMSLWLRLVLCTMFSVDIYSIYLEPDLYILSCFQFISSIGSVLDKPSPPILDVSEISGTGATVKFRSEFEKEAVVYSLRYRQGAGDGDDEKESEWKEEVLDKGVDEYGLGGLNRATKYELIGRYQLLKSKVWSQPSEISPGGTCR